MAFIIQIMMISIRTFGMFMYAFKSSGALPPNWPIAFLFQTLRPCTVQSSIIKVCSFEQCIIKTISIMMIQTVVWIRFTSFNRNIKIEQSLFCTISSNFHPTNILCTMWNKRKHRKLEMSIEYCFISWCRKLWSIITKHSIFPYKNVRGKSVFRYNVS